MMQPIFESFNVKIARSVHGDDAERRRITLMRLMKDIVFGNQ